jgi:hypothetical protein
MIKIEIAGKKYEVRNSTHGWYSSYSAIRKIPKDMVAFQKDILGYDDGGDGIFPFCRSSKDVITLLHALLSYEEPYGFHIDSDFRSRLAYCNTTLLSKLYRAQQLPETAKKDVSYLIPSEDDPTMIKFMDKSRFVKKVGTVNLWSNKFQYQQKIGKLLKSIFIKASSAQIEDSVNEWTAMNLPAEFMEVEGDDIASWYNGNRYNSIVSTGSLGASCMRYDCCEDYFGVYTDNPDKVSMILLVECGMLLGRALLWKTDQGHLFMDRIYGSDSVMEKFKMYARDKGYFYKTYQSYDSRLPVYSPKNDYSHSINLKMSVTLKLDFDYYPYIDTFSFGSYVGTEGRGVGTLYNFNNNYTENLYNSTDGGYESEIYDDGVYLSEPLEF